ncbi:MAG: exodeoxyribonuclease VII large subunit [Chlamydiota bacterium]
MQQTPSTVTELTLHIKSLLEKNFLHVSVQGEISNCKEQSSGHFYFSLKDQQSQISCVLFRGNTKNIQRLPKSGDHVILTGELSVYPPRGNYQLIVRELSFQGVGELLAKLQALKESLAAKGWFNNKKPLPSLPTKIGIITSPTGAVIQDILNVLERRFCGVHVLLYPVKVQGEGAKEEIATAIQDCNLHNLVDVLIVGRGGGSLEDLWAFNEEIVAKAIYESKIPIISAVGHQTDFTIADFVADVRAPTPSAAAEIVIKEKEQLHSSVAKYKQQIDAHVLTLIRHRKDQIKSLFKQPFLASPLSLVSQPWQTLDNWRNELDTAIYHKMETTLLSLESKKREIQSKNPLATLKEMKKKIASLQERLDASWLTSIRICKKNFDKEIFTKKTHELFSSYIHTQREKFTKLIAHLRSIDPKNLLQKGYSILFSEKKDSIILSTKSLKKEQKIFILLSDGNLQATIQEIENKTL